MLRLFFVPPIVLLICLGKTHGEIRYLDVPDVVVKGSWFQEEDVTFRVIDETLSLDLNADSIDDVQFSHGFMLEPILVSPEAIGYINTARTGILDISRLLVQTRELAIDSASSGVNSTEDLIRNQVMVDDRLDAMHQIATQTRYQGSTLLDGSSGFSGNASSPHLTVRRATSDTTPGTYDISVVATGSRAAVEASAIQTGPLLTDEVLVLNGVAMTFSAGLWQSDVINRINEFTSQTGVIADVAPSGASRVHTIFAGSEAEVSMVSNMPHQAQSTGFGTSELTDLGSDIIVNIGGTQFHGTGATVTASSGTANGLALSLAFNPSNPVQTVGGAQGAVTVIDDSIVFSGDSTETRLTLPNVRPDALGIGVWGSLSPSLFEIEVRTPFYAQDSLAVIDRAFDELDYELLKLENLLDIVSPLARNSAFGLSGSQLLVIGDEVVILSAGEPIAADSAFWTGGNDLNHPAIGYLGVEISVGGNLHYGWVGIATDLDGGFIIRDMAFETQPSSPILAGAIPEPRAACMAMLAVLGFRLAFPRVR